MVPFFIAIPILDGDQIIVVDFLHVKKAKQSTIGYGIFF
jgi:hypothetical protein